MTAWLEANGLPADPPPVIPGSLVDEGPGAAPGFVQWEDFAALCRRLGELAAELERSPSIRVIGSELAEDWFAAPEIREAVRGSSLAGLYATHGAEAFAALFPDLPLSIESERAGGLSIRLDLREAGSDARPFLELVHAFIDHAPTLLGLESVPVSAQYSPHQAQFAISSVDLRSSGSEPEPVLPAEATDTARRAAVGELVAALQAAVSEEAVIDALFTLLVEGFQCAAARLWLASESNESLILTRTSGQPIKPPTRSLPLGAFGRILGQLQVWDADPMPASYPEDLEEHLPWIALTLGYARARRELDSLRRDSAPQPDPGGSATLDSEQPTALEALRGELQASNTRWRRLMEGESIFEFDLEEGIGHVSPRAHALLGLDERAFDPAELLERVHPADRRHVVEIARQMIDEKGSAQVVVRMRHQNGSWRSIDLAGHGLESTGGRTRGLVVCRDVTDAVHMKERREQLESIVQNSMDLVALVSAEGRVISLNPAGQVILGYPDEQSAQARSLFDFLAFEDAQTMRFRILPKVHRSRMWTGEIRLCHSKTRAAIPTLASLFRIDAQDDGQTVALGLVCRDMRESLSAEGALVESEERYRMLAENPYDLISEIDVEGRFVYISPNFRQVLGYAPEELLGRVAFDFVHSDGRKHVRQIFKRTVSNETTAYGSFEFEHREGGYRWIDSTARSYRTAAGQMMVVLISRDITERRHAEEALRQSESRLRQSQKMEAIGRLAGGVAHDFNNLLTAIMGYCDLLLGQLGEDHPGRDDAEEVLRAADRAADLTRQLLAFSRRQVLQPRIIDLNSLVADTDRMLRRLIGEDVELLTELEGELWPAMADPGQIEQVILNLVVNARDAMPRGGRIGLTTANAEIREDDPLAEELPAPGCYVTLSVTDSGLGMDVATMARVFEPFFTTKESGEGTGLGLSTVFGIISQSGGHIRVDSHPGAGAAFTVYLPRAETSPAVSGETVDYKDLRGSETVLVVEDADPVRRLVQRYLAANGYSVLEAAAGIEALRVATAHNKPIDLLLTDVVMPKMNGDELAIRMKELQPDIRVLYMSGFTEDALVRHGVRSQIPLLEKPFGAELLLQTVRKTLDENTQARSTARE